VTDDAWTMTVPEAGRRLGLGRDAAYAAAKRGEIPTLRLGRRLVVPVAQLRTMLGETQRDAQEQAERSGAGAP